MMKFEDIMDAAARYLRGEMDADEKKFFEELLEQHPHLKKDLRFMQLVQLGLTELEKEENLADSEPDKKIKWFDKKTGKPLLIGIAVVILCLLAYWGYQLLYNQGKDKPSRVFYANTVRQNNDKNHAIIIEQIGSDSKNNESNRGYGVHWTSSGELAFAGIFEGNGSLGDFHFSNEGIEDIIFGLDGIEEGFKWISTLGTKETRELPRNLTVDNKDNILLIGSFGGEVDFGGKIVRANGNDDLGNHDFFIAKYDINGQFEWMDHGGGQRDSRSQTGTNAGYAVVSDDKENVIVSGTYIGSPVIGGKKLPAGGPNDDLFIINYDANGNVKWVKVATSNYMIYGIDLGIDDDGNIYVTGTFGHHNLSGQAYFEKDTLTSAGGRDIFLAKYNPSGELQWVKQAGSPQTGSSGYDQADGISVDTEGNSIITGCFIGEAVFGNDTLISFGERDVFIAKYDTEGELLWVTQAGSPLGGRHEQERAADIDIDLDGNIYITGSFTDTAQFGDKALITGSPYNFFIAKYSAEGQNIWAEQFELSDSLQQADGLSIDVDDNDNIAVTGFFTGAIRIGEWTLTSKGKEDIFILIFNENGEVVAANSMITYL